MLTKNIYNVLMNNPIYVDKNKHEVEERTYYIYLLRYKHIKYVGMTKDLAYRFHAHKTSYKTHKLNATTFQTALEEINFDASNWNRDIELSVLMTVKGLEYAKACENYFIDYCEGVNNMYNHTTYKYEIQPQLNRRGQY